MRRLLYTDFSCSGRGNAAIECDLVLAMFAVVDTPAVVTAFSQ